MMDWSHAGRLGNILTLNRQDLLEVIVRHNAYMRLRLCNTCNARILELRIEHPGLQLVALDGQPVAPRELADGHIRLADRQSGVSGRSLSVRVDLGVCQINK